MTIGGLQDNTPYELLAADDSRAVFNDESDPDYIGMARWTGLDDSEVTEVADLRTEADGGVHGNFYRGRRPVVGNIEFVPTSTTDRNTRYDKLMRAAGNALREDSILTWTPDGSAEQFIRVRKQGPIRRGDEAGYLTKWQLPLVAADPRKYSSTLNQVDESGGAAIAPNTWRDYLISLDPELYWRMDTGFTDQSGNGHNGGAGGGITAGGGASLTNIPSDASAVFDGTNDSIVSTGYSPFRNAPRTFMGWANRTSSTTDDLLFQGNGAGTPPALALLSGGQKMTWRRGSGGVAPTVADVWPGNGVDVHWAVVDDPIENIAKLYINGAFVVNLGQGNTVYETPGTLNLGGWGGGFGGLMSHFQVFHRALSAREIEEAYLFGDSGVGTVDTITNEGNTDTPPSIRLEGPTTDAMLVNMTTGERVRMDYAINDLDFVTLDFAAKTVSLNGEYNIYSSVSSLAPEWWQLAPGANDIALLNATDYRIDWRDAWQ